MASLFASRRSLFAVHCSLFVRALRLLLIFVAACCCHAIRDVERKKERKNVAPRRPIARFGRMRTLERLFLDCAPLASRGGGGAVEAGWMRARRTQFTCAPRAATVCVSQRAAASASSPSAGGFSQSARCLLAAGGWRTERGGGGPRFCRQTAAAEHPRASCEPRPPVRSRSRLSC